jgi:uncharacterized protein YjbJ (UPF0337 family)
MMKNMNLIKSNWEQVKGKLKQEYADLTNDDLTYISGKEDELIGRIKERLHMKEGQVIELIKKIEAEFEEEKAEA